MKSEEEVRKAIKILREIGSSGDERRNVIYTLQWVLGEKEAQE